MPVAEVHGDVADLHRRARHLRAEPERDALVGLDPDDDGVLAEPARGGLLERQVRGPLEHHRDLGHAAAEPLACAQVERHARPAAGVDVEADGGEGLGTGVGRDAVLLQEPLHLAAALPAGRVLPARGGQRQVRRQPDRGQDLLLLQPQVVGAEGDGFLHRGEREQLQQVVLDDVTCGTDTVVVPGPAADADVLGHGDLHVVDVVAVPHRLEQLVGEAQGQQVLDGLLAQVVVDAEHLVGREDALDDVVQLASAGQVMAERLLHHDAAPGVGLAVGQAAAGQLLDHDGERAGRDGQVERVVAPGAALLVQLLDGAGEVVERLVVVEGALDEAQAVGELLPDLLGEGGAGVLLHCVVDHGHEVPAVPVAAGETDQSEAWRQQATLHQVVDRRHQLALGQVPGDAEHDQPAGTGDAGQPSVAGVPQRVDRRCRLTRAHPASPGAETRAPVPARPAPSTAATAARPVSSDTRSVRTGRPRSLSTVASPSAWAALSRPKVNGRSGTARSSPRSPTTCR